MSQFVVKDSESKTPSETTMSSVPAAHAERKEDHEYENPLNWKELARVLFVGVAAGSM